MAPPISVFDSVIRQLSCPAYQTETPWINHHPGSKGLLKGLAVCGGPIVFVSPSRV